jgi:hypothetical protein
MLSYDPNHPRGTKFRPEELRKHRDQWFAKVAVSGVSAAIPQHRDADIHTLNAIREGLPWLPTMKWLKEHDFGASFAAANLEPLDSFVYESGDPAAEFLDMELEGLRAAFLVSLRDFLEELATNVFANVGPGPRWYGLSESWSHESRMKAKHELNRLATAASDAYVALISNGRRKLACN